jgi:hypothetical protein
MPGFDSHTIHTFVRTAGILEIIGKSIGRTDPGLRGTFYPEFRADINIFKTPVQYQRL